MKGMDAMINTSKGEVKISHHPYVDVGKVEELYSEKDGVPVKYVCTSGRGESAEAGDIFYRDTPHPLHGNKYFILLFSRASGPMISGADWIEDEVFDMIEGPEGWGYSQHRHDFRRVGDNAIDGGRAYLRLSYATPGTTKPEVRIHRHDFRRVGDNAIDGGRAYLRLSYATPGTTKPEVRRFKVKDGEFVEETEND